MNLFKKAFKRILIAVLSVGLVTVPTSLNNEVEVVNAKNMTGGEVLYLKPNSNWTQSNARFATYFFNNSTNKNTWVSMEACKLDAGVYKVTAPSGTWQNLIFCRMNPGTTANNWNNKWDQTNDLTYDGTKNCYTIAAGAWSKGSGTWSKFEETKEEVKYTVTYHGLNNKIETETILQNAKATKKFIEEDGYKLCGWYTDSSFNTKYDFESGVTKNIDLYAKYEVAIDYTIKLYDPNSVFKNQPNVHLFGDFTSTDWPGVSMGAKVGKYYEYKVDASKSYDHVVFVDVKNNNEYVSKTVDISLDGVKDGTIFALNATNESLDGTHEVYNYYIYEPSLIENTKVRIFVYNELNWAKVNCYAWDANDNPINGGWPGKAMTQIEGTKYYYYDTEVGNNVIFNNGSTQTGNLTVPSNGNNVYSNKNTANTEWYSIGDLQVYYQEQKVDDKVNVRFVSTFKGLTKEKLANYEKVGFVVGATNLEGTTKYLEFTTTSMYTSVEVNGTTVSAEQLGSTYVFTIVIKGVPTDAKLCVTPFAKSGENLTIGKTKTFVANQNL